MARIQHVKRAQQRYATKPVIDPETGEQARSPLTRNGEQLKDKRGNPRWLRLTVRDTDKPLPMPRCDFPGCEHREIKPGTPYMFVDLKVGGTKYRHAEHPQWQPWDLSSAMWARVAQVVDTAEQALDGLGEFEEADAVGEVLQAAADEARDLATEREEAADSMEDGFGHATEASDNLREHASNLESWADDLEGFSADDSPPDPDDFTYNEDGEQTDADDYDGDPASDDPADMYNAEGQDLYTAWEEWRDAVRDQARDLLGDTPEVQ
jgi:hypothetical protein